MPDELPARSSMFVVNAPNEPRLYSNDRSWRDGGLFQAIIPKFANPQHGRCRHIHHKALESEREKAEIAWNRHLKNLPALKHGKNVMPFGSSPVIPEFPKPTAGKSGREQGIKAGAASYREVTDKRR